VSYSYSRTREQLATMVLRKLGIISATQTGATADVDLVYEAADLRLKEMHRLGVVWRYVSNTPLSFAVTANVATASATADIQFPIALFITENSMDEPVQLISVSQYAGLEDKAKTGLPEKALWRGGAEFQFWPVPTATTTAKLVYERIATDTTASAAIDVDISMVRWIRDILCYDLGDVYGKSEQTMMRYERESEKAERNIRKLNAQRVDYAPVAVDDFTGVRSMRDYNGFD
jgi:hypothetical protein